MDIDDHSDFETIQVIPGIVQSQFNISVDSFLAQISSNNPSVSHICESMSSRLLGSEFIL